VQLETVWLSTLGENNRHWHLGNPGLSFFFRRSFSTAKSFQSAKVALNVFKLIAGKCDFPHEAISWLPKHVCFWMLLGVSWWFHV